MSVHERGWLGYLVAKAELFLLKILDLLLQGLCTLGQEADIVREETSKQKQASKQKHKQASTREQASE